MLYLIYVIIVLWYAAFVGIGVQNLYSHFFDSATLIFVLLPCAAILFCTRQLKAFGRSFLLVFGKKADSAFECRKSAQSVKTVCMAAVIFGIMGFMIGIINGLQSVAPMAQDIGYDIAGDVAVALISPFYASVVCAVLLPLYFIIKKRIVMLENEISG